MNGVHDMGGMQGFGPVQPEHNEPIFHAEWERQAMGLTVLMGGSGQWNIDQARSTRESLPPPLYLSSSYYQIWIEALERLMLARGLVSVDELRTGAVSAPALIRWTRRWRGARLPSGLFVPQPSSRSVSRCEPGRCIHLVTRACRGMCEAKWARCRRCVAYTFCPINTRRIRLRRRRTRANGFTPWSLRGATCGVHRPTPRSV